MDQSSESCPILIKDEKENNPGDVSLSFDDDLAASINRQLEKVSPLQGRAPICKVPPTIRNVKPSEYEPAVISIGPYHHGKEHLKDMQNLKLAMLNDLLKRNPSKSIAHYVQKVRVLEQSIRDCYEDGLKNLDSDSLIGMMTVDSCFLVELGIQCAGYNTADSCIVSRIRNLGDIARDLFLLENQIPYFVLNEIWKALDMAIETEVVIPIHLVPEGCDVDLLQMFLLILMRYWAIDPPTVNPDINYLDMVRQPHHLLDLHHMITFPSCILPNDYSSTINIVPLPCASGLERQGVKFKRLFYFADTDFTYFKNGEMSLPLLMIDEVATALLRNLIAYEQCVQYVGYKISSLALHIDSLIDTAEDVAVLKRNGILHPGIGSDEEVAILFNELCKGVSANYMDDVRRDVDEFCKSKKQAWWRELISNYFESPWKIMALTAAIILLLLAITQTTFTILPYYRPNSK